jgi:hypothetical protein
MALRLIRDRPGDRLSCHHHPSEALASSELDASTGASDPNDFTVRKGRARQSQSRVHRISPHVVTIASAPLIAGDRRNYAFDLPDVASDLFLFSGLDMISGNQK